MSSSARLRFLLDNQATVVLCTPTYALHLAEVARTEGIDLTGSPVRKVIVCRRAGRQHPRHAGAHREGLGGAPVRSQRHDRDRAARN